MVLVELGGQASVAACQSGTTDFNTLELKRQRIMKGLLPVSRVHLPANDLERKARQGKAALMTTRTSMQVSLPQARLVLAPSCLR